MLTIYRRKTMRAYQLMEEKHLKNFNIHLKKIVSKLGLDINFLNLIKDIYENPTANSIINGEGLKAFPMRSETRKGCPLKLNIVLETLASAIKKKKLKTLGLNVYTSFIHNYKKKLKTTKCFPIGKWINKLLSICTTEYYLAIKRNELPIHAPT